MSPGLKADGVITSAPLGPNGGLYTQQDQPSSEDDLLGVIATAEKPVNAADYTATPAQQVTKGNTFTIKASPGNLYVLYVTNDNAAAQLYALVNKATNPAAADAVLMWFYVPLKTTSRIEFKFGKRFSTGIGLAQTDGTFGATITALAGSSDTVYAAEVK